MRRILSVAQSIERLTASIGQIGSYAIIPLILIIAFDIVSRKLQFIQQAILNSPLHSFISPTKLQEMEWHLHTIIFFTVFAIAYLRDIHVRVDLLRHNWSSKRAAKLEFIGLIVYAIPYCILVIYFSFIFVKSSYLSGEGSDSMTGVPHRWIIKSFALSGMTLLLMSCLATLLRLTAFLFGSEEEQKIAARDLAPVIPNPNE